MSYKFTKAWHCGHVQILGGYAWQKSLSA